MYTNFQPENSIRQLLYEEREYFSSLIEQADSITDRSTSALKKSLDTLIETRQQLIKSINNINYLASTPFEMPSEKQPDQTHSSTFLTHTLIIIDAKILDLLNISSPPDQRT